MPPVRPRTRRLLPSAAILATALLFLAGLPPARAQLDPESRQILQLGYNQPVEGQGPIAGYLFYYFNRPGFLQTNLTLRVALAPTYLDSELGIRSLLGPHTDLGIGVAGGGFADSYSEIRGGRLRKQESFIGHGGEVSMAVYHLFNPLPGGDEPSSLGEVPLHAILRSAAHFSAYDTDHRTAPDFVIPEDKIAYHVRAGLRWGGRAPLIDTRTAAELSAWYEGQFRTDSQEYGFDRDRNVEARSHLFWARILGAYTFRNAHRFEASLTGGGSLHADRLNSFRLGGLLPMAAEFPLILPGYFYQEISADRFVLINANYSMPLAYGFEIIVYGSTAGVDYLEGVAQPGNWHSGVGGGLGWSSARQNFHVLAGYAYGVDAIRNGERGAQNVGIVLQWDIERTDLPEMARMKNLLRTLNPNSWRGFDRIFRQ